MSIKIRGLNGENEVEVEESTTVGELRLAGKIAGGLQVLFNGAPAADETEIPDESVLVTTAPAAKHGLTAAGLDLLHSLS